MQQPRAWLVDVYDTVLSVDFGAVLRAGARLIGVDPLRFMAATQTGDAGVMVSPTGIADSVPRILARCGLDATDEITAALLEAYPPLIREHCTVHEDAVDLLHRLRAAGAPTAFVSNCAEDTRPLLADLGLDRLVDVPAERAVMLDDRVRYCQGALDAGLTAVRIVRPAAGADGAPDPTHPLMRDHPPRLPAVATCAVLQP